MTGRIIAIMLMLSFFSGCASMSNRTKSILTMSGAAVTGGTVGYLTSPDGDRRLPHAGLWAGASAAVLGIVSLFIFDEEAKRKDAEARVDKLERELQALRESSEPELLASNRIGPDSGMGKPLPEKFRHLIIPGQGSLYKVDRWLSGGESELVHQDMILRYSQPQPNPNNKPKSEEVK